MGARLDALAFDGVAFEVFSNAGVGGFVAGIKSVVPDFGFAGLCVAGSKRKRAAAK